MDQEFEQREHRQQQDRPVFYKPAFGVNIVPSPIGRVNDVYTVGFNREFAQGLHQILADHAAHYELSPAHYGFLMQLRNCLDYRTPEEPIECRNCGMLYSAVKPNCPSCNPRKRHA